MWIQTALSTSISVILVGLFVLSLRKFLISFVSKGAEHSFNTRIERLKSDLSYNSALHLASHGAGVSAQSHGAKKRIEGIDRLWKSALEIVSLSTPFAALSFMTPAEFIENRKVDASIFPFKVLTEFNEKIDESVIEYRPFLSLEIWKHYSILSAFSARVAFQEAEFLSGRTKELWFENEHTLDLLSSSFTRDELQFLVLKQTFKAPHTVQQAIMEKILSESHSLISGERFSHEAFEQSRKLRDKIAETAREQQK